jgi:hypothetical protein
MMVLYRTPAQRARRAALADAASGHGPPAAYRSTACRVGTHDACTEAKRVQPSRAVAGVRYETCTCPCHEQQGAAR